MALTFRTGSGGKGSALTINELDNNFRHFTGSHIVSGSVTVSGSILISGSIIPSEATATLGSVDNPFQELFVSDSSIVFVSGSNKVTSSFAVDSNGALSGSFDGNLTGSFTGSGAITGSFTGSFVGDGSGLTGITGSGGTSGTSGEAGTSGTSGEAGTSGTSGESGTSGTSGNGTSGTSGTSGSGTSGTSGTSGEGFPFTGDAVITGSFNVFTSSDTRILFENLPISEPVESGRLWLSGSFSNSRYLMIRD